MPQLSCRCLKVAATRRTVHSVLRWVQKIDTSKPTRRPSVGANSRDHEVAATMQNYEWIAAKCRALLRCTSSYIVIEGGSRQAGQHQAFTSCQGISIPSLLALHHAYKAEHLGESECEVPRWTVIAGDSRGRMLLGCFLYPSNECGVSMRPTECCDLQPRGERN